MTDHAATIVDWFSRKHDFRRVSALKYIEQQLGQVEKQARSEVLAACIEVCRLPEENAGVWGDAAKHIRGELQKLQPAAKDLEEHDKQVQLELLASFLRRIDLSLIEGYAATTAPAYNEALTDLRDGYMKDFKLVADDLKELLREEELNVRRQVQQRLDALQASILHEENTERIIELEKARAITTKKSTG